MPIVQSKNIELSPGNSGSTTLDSNVTSGNCLLVLASCYNSGAASSATMTVSSTIGGSAANTWVTRENRANTTTTSAHIATADNVSAGSTTVTVTINGSTGDRYLTATVIEWSSVTTNAYDVSTGAVGSSSSAATGATAAKAQNDESVLVVFTSPGDGRLATISGFTTIYLQNANAVYQPIYVASKTVNAAGTEAATMSLTSSDEWACAIVTLRNSGGGGAATSLLTRRAARLATLMHF